MSTENLSKNNSRIINGIAFGFSSAFLIAAFAAAFFTGVKGVVFHNWYQIMISPCPLVTDYFAIGGLASAFLNAGACGMACFLFMVLLKGESHANTLAGYFLVVAHCFYGLNFLNMWPCFLAPFLYLKLKKLDFKSNLHVCMFATSFGPFISEFLFRYTQGDAYVYGYANLTVSGVILTILFSVMLGFVVPAILPGAKGWHKGYNLYNGGLAFGIFGFFIFDFMYRTMNIPAPVSPHFYNTIYESFEHSYILFGNIFFTILFLICIDAGYYLNGKSFDGFRHLVKDTGYSSNFAEKYGMPLCLINIGCYGFLFMLYLDFIILFTPGSGFTGPTFGVILAALTFSSLGQHPRNVWPILVGYLLLYGVTQFFCGINGRSITWSVSTQAYINGVAFATGLCPIVGRYGVRRNCRRFHVRSHVYRHKDLHGGLVLYNGGFTTGITALILLPILEHYVTTPREVMKEQTIRMQDMITIMEIPAIKKSSKKKSFK